MDKTLKTEIAAKGTDEASIDDITTFADILNNANVDQETFKSNRSQITDQAVKDFNDLYDDVISVATIAAKFFAKDKAIKESFSFNKLVAAQKAANPKVKKVKPKPPVA
jgi:glycyl-tRNA synthetase alpha subunit